MSTKKKSFDVDVHICFPVSVKRIEAASLKEAKKLAIETVSKFFKDPDVDPMYFDNHDGSMYDPVDMEIDGLYDIAISVSPDYKVKG